MNWLRKQREYYLLRRLTQSPWNKPYRFLLQYYQIDGNYFTGLLPTEIAGLKSIVKIEIGKFATC